VRQRFKAGGHAPYVFAILGLALLLYSTCVVLLIATRDFRAASENAWAVPALVFAALGAVVAWHQPRNPIGWLLVACGGLNLLVDAAGLYSVLDFRIHHGTLPLGRAAVMIQASAFLLAVIFGLIVLLFPDGTLPSRRWRWVLWVYAVASVMFLANQFIGQSTVLGVSHLQVDFTGSPVNNPDPSGVAASVAGIGDRFSTVILACWVGFVGRQVLGYRRTAGERRQQLKWLMAGAAICVVAVVATVLAGGSDSPGAQAVQAAGQLGIAALPVSISVGILRYRLYDIDRIISRTLAYTIVTSLLIGMYAGLVLLATRLLSFQTPVAVAAATLAAAALFNPLRQRVQRAVDRRFNRARYDADQTVTEFAARLKDAVDLDSVGADLAIVVSRALEPAHLSIWLTGRDGPG